MIEVHNLTKRFGATLAVDNLSFDVQPGTVTGFLGPNGAGKTTTLRVILGLARADKGTATIDGVPYQELPAPMQRVGALLEAKAYHPGRKARDHLEAVAQAGRIPLKRVDEVLDLVGLTEVAGRKAGTFSLGMAQRLGIAAALLGDPPVLLFDEPVNGLDPEGIVWARTLLQALASQGRTVFVSSHLMSEMALTASRVVVIGRGHLIADSTVDDLVKRSSGSVVRLRTPRSELVLPRLEAAGATVATQEDGTIIVTGLDASAVGDAAFEAGAPVHELAPVEASLEEAFMELTRDDFEFHARVGGTGMTQPTAVGTVGGSGPGSGTAAGGGGRPSSVPRLIDTARSEWTKLRTLRSTAITVTVTAILVIGFSALITWAAYGGPRHGRRDLTNPVGIIQSGWFFGLLAFVVLGVLVFSNEFATGMITSTLLATPNRVRVLMAKVGVFALFTFVVGEIMSFINFFLGHAIISAYPAFFDPALGDNNVLRAVIGMGLDAALAGLMGLALGALLRSTAAAITAGVAIVFVVPLVGLALPASWQNPFEEYWPTQAGSQLEEVTRQSHALTAWWGTGDLVLFIALILVAAGYALVKRDA